MVVRFNLCSAIKSEPEEASQEDESKENDVDEVIDEPSLIPENIIKVEFEEKQESPSPVLQSESPQLRTKKFHLAPPKIPSPSEALRIHSPAASVIHIQSTTPPIISPNGSRYCTNCDISFTFAHTFLAHKKFYCKTSNKVDRPSSGPSPNNASNVVVTLAAETSVL
jgi:zinc finger protein ZFPM1